MSKPRFDNGPWRTHFVDETLICRNDGERLVEVAQAFGDYGSDEGVERITANAHLIAAAPDMYEALSHFVTKAERVGLRDENMPEWLPKAKAALAKARGEK